MDPDENKVAETGSDTTSADPPKSGSPPHWFITVGTRQQVLHFSQYTLHKLCIINQIIIIMRKIYDSIPIQMVERMEK